MILGVKYKARVVFLYDFKLADGERIGAGRVRNKEWERKRATEYQLED